MLNYFNEIFFFVRKQKNNDEEPYVKGTIVSAHLYTFFFANFAKPFQSYKSNTQKRCGKNAETLKIHIV